MNGGCFPVRKHIIGFPNNSHTEKVEDIKNTLTLTRLKV